MKYTTKSIQQLISDNPDKHLIVEYQKPGDYTFKGVVISAYTSTPGNDCIQVNNFINSMSVDRIKSHYFELLGSDVLNPDHVHASKPHQRITD